MFVSQGSAIFLVCLFGTHCGLFLPWKSPGWGGGGLRDEEATALTVARLFPQVFASVCILHIFVRTKELNNPLPPTSLVFKVPLEGMQPGWLRLKLAALTERSRAPQPSSERDRRVSLSDGEGGTGGCWPPAGSEVQEERLRERRLRASKALPRSPGKRGPGASRCHVELDGEGGAGGRAPEGRRAKTDWP